MMTQTSKVFAGPATAPKQGANESNDNHYHRVRPWGGAGQISGACHLKDRRLSRFFIPAKNEI